MELGAQELLELTGALPWTVPQPPPRPPLIVQVDRNRLAERVDRGRQVNQRNGRALRDQRVLRHEITDHVENLRACRPLDLPQLFCDFLIDRLELALQITPERQHVVLPDVLVAGESRLSQQQAASSRDMAAEDIAQGSV